MKYKFAQEKELLEFTLSFADDPVGFVFAMYPWGESGTPLAHMSGPRDWQLQDLETLAAHLKKQKAALAAGLPVEMFKEATSSGRGPGKSAKFGMLAHWHISTHIGAQTIVAANTETQLRLKTFPEFGRWFTCALNAHWFVVDSMRITPEKWLADAVAKPKAEGGLGVDPRYWNVAGQTWTEENPSAFAGAHNAYGLAVMFDEAAGIPALVWDTTDGFFTDPTLYRMWLAASQMRENQGRFYDLFYDPKTGAGWNTRKLTIRGMPGVDQQWVRAKIEQYGEGSDFVRVEIDGDAPRTSTAQFVPSENVRAAQTNMMHPDYGKPLVLGVDPAPRGRTLLRFRQGANARDCCGVETRVELFEKDNFGIATEVMRLDAKYKPDEICVDFGMGTGVIDILKRHRLHGKLIEVKFGESPENKEGEAGSRACELWCRMRDWLLVGMIEKADALFKELTDRGWKWSGREEGKKVLESKNDLKARGVDSPDDADALACTFAGKARVRRTETSERKVLIAEGVSNSYGW